MGFASGSSIFNDIAEVVIGLHRKDQLTQDAGTEILTHVAKTLCDADWDTLDESWEEFPGNPMVEAALKAQWSELGSEGDDEDPEEFGFV